MKKKHYHKITNSYEAWWFLYGHPRLCLPERIEVRDEKHAKQFSAKHYRFVKDEGGNTWAVCRRLVRHAIEENLNIFYAKTNKPGGHGTVDNDKTKNKYAECWLEFGPLEYGYNQPEFEAKEDHARSYLRHFHDTRLDTGASTFDEALVRLARLAWKFYGDYKTGKD